MKKNKMQIDIKCLECGKITRNFELGKVFYTPHCDEVLLENTVICPKCKKDISNCRFMVKKNYLFMRFIAANLSRQVKIEIPKHLYGITLVDDGTYKIIEPQCKSRPKLVKGFNNEN